MRHVSKATELCRTAASPCMDDRLRRKAYDVSAERLQRVISTVAPTAWMKYLYYRVRIVIVVAAG